MMIYPSPCLMMMNTLDALGQMMHALLIGDWRQGSDSALASLNASDTRYTRLDVPGQITNNHVIHQHLSFRFNIDRLTTITSTIIIIRYRRQDGKQLLHNLTARPHLTHPISTRSL